MLRTYYYDPALVSYEFREYYHHREETSTSSKPRYSFLPPPPPPLPPFPSITSSLLPLTSRSTSLLPLTSSLPPLSTVTMPRKVIIQETTTTKSQPFMSPRTETTTRIIRLTGEQEAVLQNHFKRWPSAPYPADVILLAAETGLSEEDVKGWYAIRLSEWRKQQGLGGSLSWLL